MEIKIPMFMVMVILFGTQGLRGSGAGPWCGVVVMGDWYWFIASVY
jgi:hypothetical protein